MLPTSFRRFQTRQLLVFTAIVAAGFGCWMRFGSAGKALAFCLFGYCIGVLISVLSDIIDDGAIDDRNAISKMLSTIGAMFIFFSFMFGVSIFLAIVLFYLIPTVGF